MLESISTFFNKILSVFSTFGIADFLDIAVVAIIIYFCVRIIRETRAMQLVKGIAFLAVIYMVVSLFHMEASSYIFGAVFSNILIIMAIIFAPEVRNILEQIGKGTAKKNFTALIHPGAAIEFKEIEKSIEEIIKACASMSDNKVGALIIFENGTLLGNIINSGISIDAKVTRELVENIFYPKTPLHDGAMIVRNGRIHAAGCILPLTKKNVDSSLGTRHRAAIGLSEESDAIAVVVSEETGAISVARGGVLNHDISDGDLRDILTSTFLPDGSSSDYSKFSRILKKVRK